MSEPSALIFNIVHGSFVDGPGIRTTVFLKGCPLRCRWCCNPEGQSYQNQLRLQGELCTGCGQCLDICPWGALSLREGTVQVDRERCDACGACEGALLVRRPHSVGQAVHRLPAAGRAAARPGVL